MPLIIRHALSEANNRDNVGTPAFASTDAPLMPAGVEHACRSGDALREQYGDRFFDRPVAVSTYRRTAQTAQACGVLATNLHQYVILDELPKTRDHADLRRMLDGGVIPPEARLRAHEILASPPDEEIWFTHGLVIAGICSVLHIYQDRRLIPKFCEARDVQI